MAPELKSRKRKSVGGEDVKVPKTEKKVVADAPAKKRKTDTKAAAPPKPVKETKKVDEKPAKKAKAEKATNPVAEKKAEKPISENKKKLKTMKDAPDAEAAANKAAKRAKEAPVVVEEKEVEAEAAAEDSDVEMEDDQTAALLKGFESDSDSDDEMAEKDNEIEKSLDVGEFETDKKTRKALAKAAKAAAESKIAAEPGTVYLGRIPHGFYENEMRQYFKQFGDILQLRLSRNKKTGRSKHYAFIQFSSGDVASIVAKTMDNYLLFGHILKAKVVPSEQVHASLWEGANKRFKKVPWNKMEGRKLELGLTEAGWDKRAAKEQARREKKAEQMKALGYTFTAPALKSAKDVEKRPIEQVILTTEEEEVIEESVVVEEPKVEEPKPKTSKNKRKAEDDVEKVEPVATKKARKVVAPKASKVAEPVVEIKKTRAATAKVAEKAAEPVAEPKKLKRKASATDLKSKKKTKA